MPPLVCRTCVAPALAATAACSPRCQDEPRVHHRAIFCTALSGEAVPYNRRPDSVRRGGACRHRNAPGSLLKSAAARCEPVPAFPLLPKPPICPAWPSAASAPARYEPFSPNRLTPASYDSGSWPGTMAAGAREQAATCDAFVLSRRLPVPDAPPVLVRDRKQIAADLSKVFADRYPFEEGVCPAVHDR